MSQSHERLSPEEFKKLQEAFERAVELSYAERDELIGQLQTQHPRICEQLKAMLRQDALAAANFPLEATIAFRPTDETRRVVEGYELLQEIGRGGMGIVYRAHQLSPDRTVALKMIRAGRFASETDVQRFTSEAYAIARLEHPNIVTIYDFGSYNGENFFTMQLVEGSTFDGFLASHECERQEALSIFLQVCEAVAHCHEHGIIHRDLKPSNILLDKKRAPKLTDFGLAKHLEKDTDLTRTGDLMGTAGFMAPEQANGSSQAVIDARADVYALGAILYKMLTGKTPIDLFEVNLAGAIQRVRSNEIIAPRLIKRWIPFDLETVCMKCLNTCPEHRYQNARELAEELRRYVDGEPIKAKPLSRLRRVFRWSRQQPGLAVTWLALLTFYLYHLADVYFLNADVNPNESEGWRFHQIATAVVIIWSIGAYCFQKLLVWSRGALWPLFGWVTMELALLTLLLLEGAGANSALVLMYPVLVAASVLRAQTMLVAYVTALGGLAYIFHIWRAAKGDTSEGAVEVSIRFCVPLGLSILCIGLIQYYALRRSRTLLELTSRRSN